jgi:hypothetical protein
MSVTDLRDMFEDLAGSAAPPTRMAAEATFAEGRRRWRRRRAVTAAAVTMVAALTAGGLGVATAGLPTASGPVAPAASDHGGLPRQGILQWMGAADARHVYAAYTACPDGSCPKWIVRLFGSDDGGRTWTGRDDRVSLIGLEVLAADVLVSAGPAPAAPNLSTDGGRTWRTATFVDTPRGAGDGVLYCAQRKPEAACEVTVLDPAAGTYARLASPSAVTGIPSGVVETVGGAAWVGGTWVGGTDQGRPAVAVTTDAGRTWSTHAFKDPPGCVEPRCTTEVATVDGRTVYVVVTDGVDRRRTVYRGEAGGQWERLDGAEKVPYSDFGGTSFVLPDGTHVMPQVVSDRPRLDRIRFWAGRDGTYRPIELEGLPDTVHPIRRAPDGWYYTHTYGEAGLYGSADGRHWSPIGQR